MNLRQTLQMAKENDTTVQCPREKCGYIWNYSGEMEMATCPSCGYKVKVEANKLTD